MKKSTLAVLVLFAMFTLLVLPVSAENTQRVILTSGYGESVTASDQVTIGFIVGAKTLNSDRNTTRQQVANRTMAVIEALKNLGGSAVSNPTTFGESVSTYINTIVNPSGGFQVVHGMYISNIVQMTFNNTSMISNYENAALSAGAESVISLEFGLSNEKLAEERNKALCAAVIAAREDANTIASVLGEKIVSTDRVSLDQIRSSTNGPNVVTQARVSITSTY